jgi:hypothetical protein
MSTKDLIIQEDKSTNQDKFNKIINNSASGCINITEAFESLKSLPNLRELTNSHLQILKAIFNSTNDAKATAMDKIPTLNVNRTLEKLENRLESVNSSEELQIICETIIKITEKHYDTISKINKNDVAIWKKAIDFATEVAKTAITVKTKIF